MREQNQKKKHVYENKRKRKKHNSWGNRRLWNEKLILYDVKGLDLKFEFFFFFNSLTLLFLFFYFSKCSPWVFVLANSLYSFHLLFSRPRIEVVLYAHIFIFCLNCRAVHKNFQEATQHKGFLGDYVKVGEKKVPYIESNLFFFFLIWSWCF